MCLKFVTIIYVIRLCGFSLKSFEILSRMQAARFIASCGLWADWKASKPKRVEVLVVLLTDWKGGLPAMGLHNPLLFCVGAVTEQKDAS